MLQQMHVRNFAIIDEVSIEFSAGMNVLTGETGAGKSILIDALGLLLGDRASSDVVRAGSARAEMSASFSLADNTAAISWLAEHELDSDDECLLRRVINADGRSKGFINSNAVPMQSLRELGALLVDIHGQHEHQSLQRAAVQRDLLDHRAGHRALVASVREAFADYHALDAQYIALTTRRDERDSRLEFLHFQLDELNTLDFSADELPKLASEQSRLANARKLSEGSQGALDALYERDSANAQSLLAEANRELQQLTQFDPTLGEISALLDEAEVQVSEAADQLRRYTADLEADPQRSEEIDNRIANIRDVARKHRVEPEQLAEHTDKLASELTQLTQADEQLESLAIEREAARAALTKIAAKLTRARKKAAGEFASEVSNGMQTLGMPGGRFEVAVHAEDKCTINGAERIEFLVSANPGQPPQSVAKVASGGELSRISLAIQVAAANEYGVPSLIFDEVDSGVGGGVAEIVGRQMRNLGERAQVLAVTHLAQVAGQAHCHHKVNKITDGKATRTAITTLSDDARIEEVARMLGGVKITDTSRKHAREMLALSKKRA